MDSQVKQTIRFHAQKVLVKNDTERQRSRKQQGKEKCIKLLKSKNVTYIKADKGNSIVILDKEEYNNRVLNMIDEGPYEEFIYKNGNIRNPLPQMIKSAKDVARLIETEFELPNFHYKLNTPNPRIPSLYALPKIHKAGNKMRPIVSNISTPTEKISEWLLNELNRLPQPSGKYVKNTLELVNKVQKVNIQDDEILVSFDVTALYPNVPVDIAIQCMVDHVKQQNVADNKIQVYKKAAEVCMEQCFFNFRNKTYKQKFGTCMGSKLAPYLSNIFMCKLENTMSTSPLFPRVWLRYVDDVFAIIKKVELESTLELLNSQYKTIKFTCEEEAEGCLPFLDVKVIKRNNLLEFGIYRKPTNTMRVITADSHHNGSHKKAAFHSLAHRLYNIPMPAIEFEKEVKYIRDTAAINGYNDRFINRILEKHKRSHYIKSHTNLSTNSESSSKKRVCLPFYPAITNKLGNVLRRFDVDLVTKSTNLGQMIGKYKDSIPRSSKSGIYKISCTKCDKMYVGQTARTFEKRFLEHSLAVRNGDIHRSSVAEHMTNNSGHNIDPINSGIIKEINTKWKLNAYESLYMNKYEDQLMNTEESPIQSNLFNTVNSLIDSRRENNFCKTDATISIH